MYKKKKNMSVLSLSRNKKTKQMPNNIMNSMTDKEIDTLINLLRWLENRGSIIIVENNITEIHKEIRLFNPEGEVYSTYQSLNPDLLVPKVELGKLGITEKHSDENLQEKRILNATVARIPAPPGAIRKQVTPIGVRKKQKRGRARLTRMSKIGRRRLKEKQEQELALALAEATRGTYIGKAPTPKPSTLLLLRRKYRPQVKCTITDIPKILVKPTITLPAEVSGAQANPTELPSTVTGTDASPTQVPATQVTVASKPPPVKKDYKCEQCDKILKTQASLKSHKISHSNLQEVICEICGKTFNHTRGLRRHLSLHEGARNYTCNRCPATFMFKQKLKEHVLAHTGEKRFHCNVCNRSFMTRKHLKTHEVVHSEKRPFECSFCSKSFRRVSHLTQHVRIHTGEKRFQCIPCGKGFVQQTSLQCHNRTYHKNIVPEETETQTVAPATTISPVSESQNQSFPWRPHHSEAGGSQPTTEILIASIPDVAADVHNIVQSVQQHPYPWKRHLAQKSLVLCPDPTVEQEAQFVWKPHLAKASEPTTTATPAGQTTTTLLVPVTDYNQPHWPSTSTFYQFS